MQNEKPEQGLGPRYDLPRLECRHCGTRYFPATNIWIVADAPCKACRRSYRHSVGWPRWLVATLVLVWLVTASLAIWSLLT